MFSVFQNLTSGKYLTILRLHYEIDNEIGFYVGIGLVNKSSIKTAIDHFNILWHC